MIFDWVSDGWTLDCLIKPLMSYFKSLAAVLSEESLASTQSPVLEVS